MKNWEPDLDHLGQIDYTLRRAVVFLLALFWISFATGLVLLLWLLS